MTSIEEAERLSFRGSPTVLMNGVDIEPGVARGIGLGWRLYGLAGVPPRHLIEASVQAASLR